MRGQSTITVIFVTFTSGRNSLASAFLSTLQGKTSLRSFHNRPRQYIETKTKSSSIHMRATHSKPSVGIIGGGIAGLSCANHLASSNHFSQITVFDTGRLRPGGRCSSRYPNDPPPSPSADNNNNNKRHNSKATILGSQIIDHAAQIITVSDSENNLDGTTTPFSKQVKEWEKDGILKRFPEGSVCLIKNGKNDNVSIESVKCPPGTVMYHGTNGMGSIPNAMANKKGFQIEQDVWVSPSNGVKYLTTKPNSNDGHKKQSTSPRSSSSSSSSSSPSWRIKAKGQKLGDFDQIVIAHNGKCADRLMSKTPAKALHSLLRTNFSPTVPKHGGKRMTLNSIYSLTFAVKVVETKETDETSILGLPPNLISAFIQNEETLRFLSCNSRKYPSSKAVLPSNIQVWTILSSPKFAKKYKGPQENLPPETVSEVSFLLLQALERSLHLKEGTLTNKDDNTVGDVIVDSKLQLWGAAVPLNTWNTNTTNAYSEQNEIYSTDSGFLYDGRFGVGACGDWLLEASIEGAWESGRRLAEWMMKAESFKDMEISNNGKGRKSADEWSVGLPPNGSFQASTAVSKAGIGSLKTAKKS